MQLLSHTHKHSLAHTLHVTHARHPAVDRPPVAWVLHTQGHYDVVYAKGAYDVWEGVLLPL